MAGEKTEAPTPKKLRDARKKGDVAKSQEIVSVGVLLAFAIGMRYIGPGLGDYMQETLRSSLATPMGDDFTNQSIYEFGRRQATQMVIAMLPFFGLLAIAGVLLNVGQSGLMLTGDKLKPKPSHLDPRKGLKRIYGTEGLMNLGKTIAKMGTVAIVVGLTLRDRMEEITGFGQLSIPAAVGSTAEISFDIALRTSVVLFILTIGEFAWQRRQHFKRQMMTKEEVRREHKDSEGDPHIKAAIRRKRQAMLNRMIAAVPTADVIVTNPTHFAVAIKYDPVGMAAPVVVAKGQDLLAQRIKEVARKAGVPVLEEPPLARALHKSVAVGAPIPANLYQAVAEVLAWVYALRERTNKLTRRTTGAQGAT